MSTEALQEALVVHRQLKAAKDLVKQLENELAPFKDRLKDAMGIAGNKLLECAEGYAKWVDRKGTTKWNTNKLEERLGDEVDNYRTVGEESQFVKLGLYEQTNQE